MNASWSTQLPTNIISAMPMTPPTRPPTAPSIVFLGLTRGASLCLPKSIPAKRAKVSDPKEMARGTNTSSLPTPV